MVSWRRLSACVLIGSLGWTGMLAPVPRAEAYVVPVFDAPNFAERLYEIIQKALQIGIDWETLWAIYENYVRLTEIYQSWETELAPLVWEAVIASGVIVDDEVVDLILDLHELIRNFEHGLLYGDPHVADKLFELLKGYSMSVEPDQAADVEELSTDIIMETQAALLDLLAHFEEIEERLADERAGLRDAVTRTEGGVELAQLNVLALANLGAELQLLTRATAAAANAQAVDSAVRENKEGRLSVAMRLWMTEVKGDVIELEGAPRRLWVVP